MGMKIVKRPTDVRGAIAALREAETDLAQEIEGIEADEELWPEAKASRARQARQEASLHVRDLDASAQELIAEERRRYARLRTSRAIDPTARERVRSLLNERGASIPAIIEHAKASGDSDLIAALRAEVLDSALGGREPGRSRPSMKQAQEVEAHALLCDRALVELDGDKALGAALEDHEAAESYGTVREFAILATSVEPVSGGTLAQKRLEMAHSLSPEGEVNGG
jgi:hypothetical protein